MDRAAFGQGGLLDLFYTVLMGNSGIYKTRVQCFLLDLFPRLWTSKTLSLCRVFAFLKIASAFYSRDAVLAR